jgi:hypothetical protein
MGGEACLVLETDTAPAGRPGSSTSVQVASIHTVTACSSRSATRRAATCGLKPSRCISLIAPETLQETWNFLPISIDGL